MQDSGDPSGWTRKVSGSVSAMIFVFVFAFSVVEQGWMRFSNTLWSLVEFLFRSRVALNDYFPSFLDVAALWICSFELLRELSWRVGIHFGSHAGIHEHIIVTIWLTMRQTKINMKCKQQSMCWNASWEGCKECSPVSSTDPDTMNGLLTIVFEFPWFRCFR